MTLLDLYEPLFQYICVVNRIAHKGGPETLEYGTLRANILALLSSIKQRADQEPLVALQAGKLELPVLFFVDSMIAESKLPGASQWHQNRLAFEKNNWRATKSSMTCSTKRWPMAARKPPSA
ncbi:MAG: DotU family type IV/VI secretion system protein [Chthoniobacter sp.]